MCFFAVVVSQSKFSLSCDKQQRVVGDVFFFFSELFSDSDLVCCALSLSAVAFAVVVVVVGGGLLSFSSQVDQHGS